MIRALTYDDGAPIWSAALGTHLGEPRRPAWRCTIHKRDPDSTDIVRWLEENLIEDEQFEMTFRFNSGDPAMFVEIYDRNAAAMFTLAWGAGG